MRVGEYIRASAALPWDWGGVNGQDCCTCAAGWVMERGNPDPMAFIRGRYDSERSALRRIGEGGGLIPLWTRGMIEAGVPEADEPREGDVGIVLLPTDEGAPEVCALYTGERWAARWTSGFVVLPATPLALWRP